METGIKYIYLAITLESAMFSSRLPDDLSPTLLFQKLEAKKAAGQTISDLTNTNPTTAGLAFETSGILKALRQQAPLTYLPNPRGIRAARQVVCDYYREKGTKLTPEHVSLTASSSEAFSILFKLLCNPGQTVLCPRPSYPLLAPLAGLEDIKLNHYDLVLDSQGGWRYDCPRIESALTNKTRAVIVVSPNNPTGSVLDPSQRQELQKLCAERGIPLIVDEVFLDYCISPQNTAATESQSLTFVLSGFSKILGLPQLKLGWIATVGPENLLQQASDRLDHMLDAYLSVSGPVQAAAEALFREKSVLQTAIHERLKLSLSIIEDTVNKNPCLELLPGQGGWSAVLAVNTGITDEVLALYLLETHGVFLHPGYLFDFPRDNCLVMSLLTQPEILKKGLTAIADTLG